MSVLEKKLDRLQLNFLSDDSNRFRSKSKYEFATLAKRFRKLPYVKFIYFNCTLDNSEITTKTKRSLPF